MTRNTTGFIGAVSRIENYTYNTAAYYILNRSSLIYYGLLEYNVYRTYRADAAVTTADSTTTATNAGATNTNGRVHSSTEGTYINLNYSTTGSEYSESHSIRFNCRTVERR